MAEDPLLLVLHETCFAEAVGSLLREEWRSGARPYQHPRPCLPLDLIRADWVLNSNVEPSTISESKVRAESRDVWAATSPYVCLFLFLFNALGLGPGPGTASELQVGGDLNRIQVLV